MLAGNHPGEHPNFNTSLIHTLTYTHIFYNFDVFHVFCSWWSFLCGMSCFFCQSCRHSPGEDTLHASMIFIILSLWLSVHIRKCQPPTNKTTKTEYIFLKHAHLRPSVTDQLIHFKTIGLLCLYPTQKCCSTSNTSKNNLQQMLSP